MQVYHEFTVDLVRRGLLPPLRAVQGDHASRILKLTLTQAGQPWQAPENTAAAVRYRCSDGSGGWFDTLPDGSAAAQLSANVLTVTLPGQVFQVSGAVALQVELTRGDKCLSTFTLDALVEKNPAAGALESKDYINMTAWMVGEVKTRVAQLVESGELTGQPETVDIRNGYDGTRYGSAGDAVRTQVANVPKQIAPNGNRLYFANAHVGYVENVYGETKPNATNYRYFDPVKVKAGETYKVFPRVRFVVLYDENGAFLSEQPTISPSALTGIQTFTPTVDGTAVVSVYAEDYEKGLCGMTTAAEDAVQYPVFEHNYMFNAKSMDALFRKLEAKYGILGGAGSLAGVTVYNFGDSIAAGDGNSGTGYAELLASKYGATVTDFAVGGSTLSRVDGQTMQSILDHIDNAPSAMPDVILLDGGANDYSQYREMGSITGETVFDPARFDETTYIGGLETALYKLHQKYPGAVILWIYTHRENTRTQKTNGTVTVNFTTMHDLSLEVCKKWAIPVVDLYNEGGLNTQWEAYRNTYTNNADGTHPNAAGYERFYLPLILAKLKALLSR